MRLKPGVRVIGLRPEVVLAMVIADGIWKAAGATELVVTSVNDGTHMRKSEHSTGLAFDCRTRNLPPGSAPGVAIALREALGPDFDVIHESIGTRNEHIHVEYDPV